jgi:hypothetical protein
VNPLSRSIDDCLLTVKLFKRDVQIKFSFRKNLYKAVRKEKRIDPSRLSVFPERPKEETNPKRSKIIEFSRKSARRLKHTVRNSEEHLKVFITLTYPGEFPCDGRQTKKHLNAFLQFLRRKGIKFIWVLEFQERGAPHYHVIASDCIPKTELAERWYNIVGSGDEKHLRAGTQIDFIKSKEQLYGYLSNYVKKLEQKTPPAGFENVGRFWGASRGIVACLAFKKVGHYFDLARSTKYLRRWRKAHLRQFGIRWKWKGKGFIALDGASFIKQLIFLKC